MQRRIHQETRVTRKGCIGIATALTCMLGMAACSAASPADEAHADAGTVPAPVRGSASATGGQRGNGQPYEVVGSEVWDVPDPASGRTYQVFVALPAGYAEAPARRYPVLYVTDADYAFPLVRQMARRLNGEGPAIEDFILVGLSYALGDDGMTSRRRDYTPTARGPSGAPADQAHGQSAAYITYLRDQVIPFVASRYRSDEHRRLFLGHSYGGLLGTQILLEQPTLFAGYILGSPSYWFDKQYVLRQEHAQARTRTQLPAQVYMYVGEREARTHGAQVDMVADAQAMARSLQGPAGRPTAGLQLRLDVLAEEDHLSVAPRGFMLGLKQLLGVGTTAPVSAGAAAAPAAPAPR